jgi:glucose-1-phosphate thymidylyltransferase
MNYLGVIPAAGLGSRIGPLEHAKELLPIAQVADETGALRPLPVIEASLRQIKTAGIDRCLVITSSSKPELATYLKGSGGLGLDIDFVEQQKPEGLAAAVALTLPASQGAATCLLLPDTIVRPPNALKAMRATFEERGADLVLGVFPTSKPKELGPVRFDGEMRVTEVQDKPAETDLGNTWGLAIWGPRFSKLLAAAPSNANLGRLFHHAATSDLNVFACWFEEGDFHDVGTPQGLAHARSVFAGGL